MFNHLLTTHPTLLKSSSVDVDGPASSAGLAPSKK